ncbi:MAG TPA: hypothetical protein VIF37_02785 [Methylobacter sp.]|jgi:hypothetical protein
MFKKESGDWKKYKLLASSTIVDFHFVNDPFPTGSFYENMDQAYQRSLDELKNAQQDEISYVIYTHGHSTSRRGRTSARSQIRKLMRSKDATPYIIRSKCIQHPSVFVAAIRPSKE